MTRTGAAASGNVDELELIRARVARLETLVDDLQQTTPVQTGPSGTERAVGEYATLEDWVNHWLLTWLEHQPSGQTRWCNNWPDHPEAVTRLDASWDAWNTLKHDPNLGMSTWLRDHHDPCLTHLHNPNGPFNACTPERHTSRPA